MDRFTSEAPSALRSIKRVVSGLPPDDTVCPGRRATTLQLVTGYFSLRDTLLERSNVDIAADDPGGDGRATRGRKVSRARR